MIVLICTTILGILIVPFCVREFVKGWKAASVKRINQETLATKEIGEDILEFPSPLIPIKVFFPVMIIEQKQNQC